MLNKNTYLNFLYLALLPMLNTGFLHAQNLVPNPDFEELKSCIYFHSPENDPTRFRNQIEHWYSLAKGPGMVGSEYQPELFSLNNYMVCEGYDHSNIPGILDFSEEELSQNNIMCGFFLVQIYINLLNQNTFPLYREGIGVKLTEPLKTNGKYCISLDARVSSRGRFLQDGTYGNDLTPISHLGMCFSADSLALPLAQLVQTPYLPLYSENKSFISDTSQWTRIGNIYTAQGGEQHIGISNFEPDDTLMFQFLSNYNPYNVEAQIALGKPPQMIIRFSGFSYYFFDNVSIVPLEDIKATASASQIMQGEQVVLTASEHGEQVQWFAGDTLNFVGEGHSLGVFPDSTTTYILKAKNCMEWMYDSVTVHVLPNSVQNVLSNKLEIVNTMSSESFTIRYNSNERPVPIDVFLYDAAGRIVKSFRINETTEVSLREMASGIYFCSLSGEGYVGFTTKILKP